MTRRMALEGLNADLTRRLEESEARSRAFMCEVQQVSDTSVMRRDKEGELAL